MSRTRIAWASLAVIAALALVAWPLPSRAQSNPLSISATPSSGGAPLAVTFEAFYQGYSYFPTYDWDFGDGSAHSAEQYATHTYTSPGTYHWTVVSTVSGPTSSATATNAGDLAVGGPILLRSAAAPGKSRRTGTRPNPRPGLATDRKQGSLHHEK